MMNKVLYRLFSTEIGQISENKRPWFTLLALIVATIITIGTLLSLHFYNVLTVTGDSGAPTLKYIYQLLDKLSYSPFLYYGTIVWLAFFVWYRGYIAFKSYTMYEKNVGKKVDLREMLTIFIMNILNTLMIPMLVIVGFVIASLFGIHGFHLLNSLVALADGWVQHVPTVVSLPNWAAMIATWFLITFMHYWLHRLAHTRRALWLLLHRPHHLTEHLTMVTVAPVVSSFPVWILLVIPYTFLFGAAGKLFSHEPLYLEFIVFQMFWMLIQTWAHASAMYEEGIQKKWLVWMSHFTTDGVYHVLHHSRALETQRLSQSSTNTVNIGTGSIFACWDRLFGTYQPLVPKLPEMGLIGRPKLFMNPVRLACAGVMQLLYELYHNRSMTLWYKIIFGTSAYTPPRSRDFAVHER